MYDQGLDGVLSRRNGEKKAGVAFIVIEFIKGMDLVDLMNDFFQKERTRDTWPGEDIGKIFLL